MGKGFTKILSNLGVEKGKGVVSNAVNVAKNGGAAYKKAMSTNGLGDRMSSKISAGVEDVAKAMQTDEFKALDQAAQAAYRDQFIAAQTLVEDLKGLNSSTDVVKTIAEGRALGRGSTVDGPGFTDYLAASREVAKDYFWTGATKGQRAVRFGTVAAGYGVASGTTRYLSGGSMTYNSKGERDIAGIPFM